MEDGSDDLDRLRRILDRIEDPEQREQLRRELEGRALDELADQEEPRMLPAPVKPIIEPDPTVPAPFEHLSVHDLAGFLPEVHVEISDGPLRVSWSIGPARG